jgi:hypothetical protein
MVPPEFTEERSSPLALPQPIELRDVAELAEAAERVVERFVRVYSGLLPGVEIHHIGATAMPFGHTKGDVDLNLRVCASDFAKVQMCSVARVASPSLRTGRIPSPASPVTDTSYPLAYNSHRLALKVTSCLNSEIVCDPIAPCCAGTTFASSALLPAGPRSIGGRKMHFSATSSAEAVNSHEIDRRTTDNRPVFKFVRGAFRGAR